MPPQSASNIFGVFCGVLLGAALKLTLQPVHGIAVLDTNPAVFAVRLQPIAAHVRPTIGKRHILQLAVGSVAITNVCPLVPRGESFKNRTGTR